MSAAASGRASDLRNACAAGMRQAVAQATHHCHNRSAFGATLSDQPLMQNVLADLIIENEAALAYTMRVARAMDNQNNEHERLLARLAHARGVRTIIEMVAMTRFDCMIGSAAGMRHDSSVAESQRISGPPDTPLVAIRVSSSIAPFTF